MHAAVSGDDTVTRHDDGKRVVAERFADLARVTRIPTRLAISPYVSVRPGAIVRVTSYTLR